MALSQEEILKIAEVMAPLLVQDVRKTHHEFWIDPENHYNDHKRCRIMTDADMYEMQQLLKLFRATKALWFKAFIGFAVVGTAVVVGLMKLIGK